MKKKNFNACRVVLTSGSVIMYYFTGSGLVGLASAGTLATGNCTVPYADGQEEFERIAKEWADRFQDREDVEYIEFV